jgi:hypothetical protein
MKPEHTRRLIQVTVFSKKKSIGCKLWEVSSIQDAQQGPFWAMGFAKLSASKIS